MLKVQVRFWCRSALCNASRTYVSLGVSRCRDSLSAVSELDVLSWSNGYFGAAYLLMTIQIPVYQKRERRQNHSNATYGIIGQMFSPYC